MPKPLKYTKVKVIKITQIQHETLLKITKNKVNVAQFIRNAIAEKIKKEYAQLIKKPKQDQCPF